MYSGELSLECKNIDGKWGYANSENMFVITPTFDEANCFSEGLAAVKDGGNGDLLTLKAIMLSIHNLTMLGVFSRD